MEPKLSISDIEYIYNLAGHKTDEQLAVMIKKPLDLVQKLFSLMVLPKRPWEKFDNKPIKEKKQLKPLSVGRKKKAVKKKKPVKKEKKPHSSYAQAMDRQKIRKSRNNQSIYTTKPLDLSGKVRVKLNAKTEVWVLPGTDIAALKKKLNIA